MRHLALRGEQLTVRIQLAIVKLLTASATEFTFVIVDRPKCLIDVFLIQVRGILAVEES